MQAGIVKLTIAAEKYVAAQDNALHFPPRRLVKRDVANVVQGGQIGGGVAIEKDAADALKEGWSLLGKAVKL